MLTNSKTLDQTVNAVSNSFRFPDGLDDGPDVISGCKVKVW